MKKFKTLFLTILTVVVFALCAACGGGDKPAPKGPDDKDKPQIEVVDYAGRLTLDLTSNTKKQEVTMRLHVDGDTTHFNPLYSSSISNPSTDFAGTDGYIKARYIAINTPESTGKIEQWGGKASKFTRSKLEGAESIIVESDDAQWNFDSNGRYILWVWYKPQGENEYRNLNIEILQEGLALGSSVSANRYGQTAMDAMVQAQTLKLYLFSGVADPDFPGEAVPVTLKELRCNIEDYYDKETDVGKRVKVEGIITSEFDNCVYIEDEDAESGVSFGMQVFYGYENQVLNILKIGNRVSVVGVVSYYEAGETYQLSDIKYNRFHPEDPDNTQLISEGNPDDVTFTEVSAKDIVSGKKTISWIEETEDDDGNVTIETVEKEFDYGYVVWHTSVTVKNLKVVDTYTTKTGNSAGAISLTCQSEDGATIVVRTTVLTDENGDVIKEEEYAGKTITVKGIVDKYDGKYQIKVYLADFIEVLD